MKHKEIVTAIRHESADGATIFDLCSYRFYLSVHPESKPARPEPKKKLLNDRERAAKFKGPKPI